MKSRLSLFLITAAALISAAACSSGGGSGSTGGGGNPPQNPVPSISSIAPTNANAGGADFTLTANGASFISTSTVNWNGSSRTTTEISDTQLTAAVTAADIAAIGTAQITVENPTPGGGTSNSLDFAITAAGATAMPGFLYIANSVGVSTTEGNISVYSVDPDTGSLTPVSGSPFAGAPLPTALALAPSSKFLYISSGIDNLAPAPVISAFSLDPSTGVPSPIPGSPFVSGLEPESLAIDSTGKFLYSVDESGTNNSISEFSIDESSGALTPITQTQCLEVSGQAGGASAVAADPVAGFLLSGPPMTLPEPLIPPAIDPSGKFLYVVSAPQGGTAIGLSGYEIDASTGTLSPIAGSPFALPATAGSPVLLTITRSAN